MNRLVTFGGMLSAVLASAAAHAQSHPSKPIKVLIAFVAGGSSDKSEVERWTQVVKRGGIQPV